MPAHEPALIPIAVDLGSGELRLWAAGRGTMRTTPDDAGRLVRRGRIVDGPGCIVALSRLILGSRPPVPAGAVVVACRPVLSSLADQYAVGHVLTAVLAPSRLLFIDSVRAAALGVGGATGPLLIADVGAQLTEVAVLDDGRVAAARIAAAGTRDLRSGATAEQLAGTVGRLVNDLRRDAEPPVLPAAMARGMVVVGDGATRPDLTAQLAATLRIAVRVAEDPRTAALTGAGLTAMAAARHDGG